MTTQPRTAAGRTLLNDSWRHWSDPDNWRESLRLRILAIEAEAAEPASLDADLLAQIIFDVEDAGTFGYDTRDEGSLYDYSRNMARHILARLAAGDKGSESFRGTMTYRRADPVIIEGATDE